MERVEGCVDVIGVLAAFAFLAVDLEGGSEVLAGDGSEAPLLVWPHHKETLERA